MSVPSALVHQFSARSNETLFHYCDETHQHTEESVRLAHIQQLLENHISPNIPGKNREVPLHRAVLFGTPRIIEALLQGGAEIDITNAQGLTPLMKAAALGPIAHVQTLITHGAQIDKTDRNSKSALFWACLQGSAEAAKLLLEHGANPARLADQEESILEAIFLRQEGQNAFLKKLGLSAEQINRCRQLHQQRQSMIRFCEQVKQWQALEQEANKMVDMPDLRAHGDYITEIQTAQAELRSRDRARYDLSRMPKPTCPHPNFETERTAFLLETFKALNPQKNLKRQRPQ